MRHKSGEFFLRPLLRKDLPEAMRLKDAEGWNQTEKDWEVFLEGNENINFVAEMANKTVGTLTAINYENKVAWLGMMIVDRAFRGLGISRKLMTTAIERLKQINCRSIKLDATPQGRPVYVKLGFIEEYTIIRLVHPGFRPSTFTEGNPERIKQATGNEIHEIVELDRKIFGANRNALITNMIRNNPEKSFVLKDNDKITGFALGRDGTRFTQVGPVAAANDRDAMLLLMKALEPLPDQPVVVDLPEDKNKVLNWLLENGFENQRPLYRMYLEDNPYPGQPEHQYAICGPEFG